MKTLFFECNMGAAGDMLMAALLELHGDPSGFIDRFHSLGIPEVHLTSSRAVKCGITGTHVSVTVGGVEEISSDIHEHSHSHGHDGHNPLGHTHSQEDGHTHGHSHSSGGHNENGEHYHNNMHRIEDVINSLQVSPKVKKDALEIYSLIAEAEGHAHGVPVTEIHFHEVGAMDAVADIVGVCMLMEEIAPERVLASPVCVGSGFVRCAHGVLPVPAPATAYILRDAPIYSGNITGELCTPTGAAILKHFAGHFGPMPEMRVGKIGYGMGKKDFEAANCVRAFIGEIWEYQGGPNSQVAELRCNVDDMTGEALGYACRLLLKEGARDVFITPAQMKKDRPGSLITCICDVSQSDRFAELMLKHTTTFGVRKTLCGRYTLTRETIEIDTPYGAIRVKTGHGYGVDRVKFEYEDIAASAEKYGLSLAQVEDCVHECIKNNK